MRLQKEQIQSSNRSMNTPCQNCGKTLNVPPEAVGEAYCNEKCAKEDGLNPVNPKDVEPANDYPKDPTEIMKERLGGR